MKNIILISAIALTFYSCVQNYSNEYKEEAIKTCECMSYKQSLRKREIAKEIVFIYDDKDYKECVLDAKINMVDTKSNEFTLAIDGVCPKHLETQQRYIDEL
jgi:hypothetical protein